MKVSTSTHEIALVEEKIRLTTCKNLTAKNDG
jgi:hypothetical protein